MLCIRHWEQNTMFNKKDTVPTLNGAYSPMNAEIKRMKEKSRRTGDVQ